MLSPEFRWRPPGRPRLRRAVRPGRGERGKYHAALRAEQWPTPRKGPRAGGRPRKGRWPPYGAGDRLTGEPGRRLLETHRRRPIIRPVRGEARTRLLSR